MRKLLLILTLLISSISFSQAPEGINYQTVIPMQLGKIITSAGGTGQNGFCIISY
jgi:hypothetical protein